MSFLILFKDRSYLGIFQTSWERRTCQKTVEIMIFILYYLIYIIFVSFDDRDWYVRNLRCFF